MGYLSNYQMYSDPEMSSLEASQAAAMAPPAAAGGGAEIWKGAGSAGIGVAGSFLANYMAQKAAEEKQKKQNLVQIEQQYGQSQNQGLESLMNTYRTALLGR